MGKLKTHKGTKKVLNIRQSGSITTGRPGHRHNTGKKTSQYNRKKRDKNELSTQFTKKFKNLINIIK